MNKSVSKIVVPLLGAGLLALIFFSYFYKPDSLGLWSAFDTNNNANKDIRVEVVKEKKIEWDMQAGAVTFYARDAAGIEQFVQGPLETSKSLEMAKRVTMRGHLHKDHFHASEILVK